MADQAEAGRRRVADRFSFAAQAERYQELFAQLCPLRPTGLATTTFEVS
jgi:hypothetical protein